MYDIKTHNHKSCRLDFLALNKGSSTLPTFSTLLTSSDACGVVRLQAHSSTFPFVYAKLARTADAPNSVCSTALSD